MAFIRGVYPWRLYVADWGVARTILSLALLLSSALGAATVPAQSSQRLARQNAGVTETKHLKIVVPPAAAAAPGATVSLFVDVTLKPRMHVYAPGQEDYVPISLTLVPNEMIRVRPTRYPRPEKYFFAPLKETQLVYSKPFRIVQDVSIADDPAAGERARATGTMTVEGTLRYQACDDAICYLPQRIPVSWTLALKTGRR